MRAPLSTSIFTSFLAMNLLACSDNGPNSAPTPPDAAGSDSAPGVQPFADASRPSSSEAGDSPVPSDAQVCLPEIIRPGGVFGPDCQALDSCMTTNLCQRASASCSCTSACNTSFACQRCLATPISACVEAHCKSAAVQCLVPSDGGAKAECVELAGCCLHVDPDKRDGCWKAVKKGEADGCQYARTTYALFGCSGKVDGG